jgi:hypothetical protein
MNEKVNSLHLNYLDFDIYSKRIGLFYHNKEIIGSLFGFILTVIYIIVSLSLFIFYTITTIKKRNISVHDSYLYQKEAPSMNLNPNLFYFAFGVENNLADFTRFIDETIYYPKVYFINKIKEGSIFKSVEESPLDIERCKQEKFGEEYQKLLVKNELNNSYCIKDLNLTLIGNTKFDRMSYIKIEIYPCSNTTENQNHCKSKEIINSYLSGTFISVLIKDIGLEPTNYEKPIVPTFQDIYVTIDKHYFRDFTLFFGIVEIQTDEGLFYEKIKKKRYLNFIKTSQGIYNQNEESFYNKSMCDVEFRISDDIRVQKRTYMKMNEVFVITGGYMQLISTIFTILTFLTKTKIHQLKLVNDLFDFCPKQKKIFLKYDLQKLFLNPSINDKKNENYSSNNLKNISSDKYSNSIFNYKKNNFLKLNNTEKIKVDKISENNHNKKGNKEKDSSNIENKSKAGLLNRGINSISQFSKNSIFKNQIIKRKDSFYEKKKCLENNGIRKIKFIPLFYQFFQNNEDINLFNLSMSLYKKKMDIIYLFHIILVFEKLLELEKEKIMNNKEIMINLKEIEFCS